MSTHDDFITRAGALVSAALEEVNQLRAKRDKIPDAPETVLLGKRSGIDSLGLVNLLVAVENQAEEREGLSLMLASDLGSKESAEALASIDSLTRYLATMLEEQNHG